MERRICCTSFAVIGWFTNLSQFVGRFFLPSFYTIRRPVAYGFT
jgi:hypothetical protein